jgi:anti-sigma factor RsiW
MLTCRELIEFLNEYVDGTLDAARRAEFERHLGLCRDCENYLRSYRSTIDLCKDALDEPVPADVPDELIQAILASRES